MTWKINLALIVLSALGAYSCGVYSFTGASISPTVKTIAIQTFYNNALLGPSNMSASLTEKIKDYYLRNTNLILVDEEGDLQIEGNIDNFTLLPVSISSANSAESIDLASLTRIKITVRASYTNIEDDQYDFDKKFSFFKDFDQSKNSLSSVEEQYVDKIFDQIILDIFNSSVANW